MDWKLHDLIPLLPLPALVFVAECTHCILIKRYAYRALPRLTFKYSKNCDIYDLSEATPLVVFKQIKCWAKRCQPVIAEGKKKKNLWNKGEKEEKKD